MSEPLEQVLADEREQANVLRMKGFAREADMLTAVVERVAAAAEDYTTWLDEHHAMLHSGLAPRSLRRRFRELYDGGNARYNVRHEREYRKSALPRRPQISAAREAARERRSA